MDVPGLLVRYGANHASRRHRPYSVLDREILPRWLLSMTNLVGAGQTTLMSFMKWTGAALIGTLRSQTRGGEVTSLADMRK